jgi:hypothetical protein
MVKDDFYKGIQKLYDHANQCVQLEGGMRGGVVVKALHYKLARHGFDS